MDLAALFLGQATAFALIVSRLGGFIVVSPFPGNNVTPSQRVGLLAVLAWVVTAFAPTQAVPRELGLGLLGPSMLEFCCGLIIGFTFRMLMAGAEMLGHTLSLATGMSSPGALNPAIEQQDTILDRIVTLMALLVALAIGAHRVALAYLLESFRAIPVGSTIAVPAALGTFVDMAGDAFAVGVHLGMPALAVSLVVQLALAMIARAAPSVQIFSVGLAITVGAGFATILASFHDMGAGLADHFATLGHHLEAVLSAVGGAR